MKTQILAAIGEKALLAERKLAAERERFVQLFDQAPTFLAPPCIR
jgi:hypothetical protein